MSIPVPLRSLDGAVAERGAAAFVLTVSDRGTPHVVHAEVTTADGGLFAVVGAGTAHNAAERPHVSVLYPCRQPDDYSLIIDAISTVAATQDGFRLHLAPTRAVLHRPAPAPDSATSPCASDCIPLPLGFAS